MALLKLCDIGKIYVSEGNVNVGIRGVNLSFDRGEFVAITGKSGSGKSTLLNVISGMDSYEEGELYIEGQTTSHFLQPEWEEYREKYISFIFQDYNIIESFTVLQNVELALMHIEDKKQRRARALELIDRVGLSSHVKHKGSKLSGGQKQRTVIARALAKDSPIILADEPTGNLDSNTSKEIIKLLREVSKDKLLIVVTHNFDQVEAYATRHIRVFDGAVESDHVITEPKKQDDEKTVKTEPKNNTKKIKKTVRNGITLGKILFTSKPRLSVFLCILMLVGTLGIFLMTSLCGNAANLFDDDLMFNHINGRVVVTTRNGQVLSQKDVETLASEYGADSYLRFDLLLDGGRVYPVVLPTGDSTLDYEFIYGEYTYGEDFGNNIIGRYPQADNEVFLYLPISHKPDVGDKELKLDNVIIDSMSLKLVGVKYYYDNNITPKCLLTEEGFRTLTAIHYLTRSSNANVSVSVTTDKGEIIYSTSLNAVTPSFDIDDGKIYVDCKEYEEALKNNADKKLNTAVDFHTMYYKYDYNYGDSSDTITFETKFTDEDITHVKPNVNYSDMYYAENGLIVSDELLREIAESILDKSYKQVSLFFENDRAAAKAASLMQEKGYIAVPSYTTYEPDPTLVIVNIILSLLTAFVWFISIVFLAFFINLCTGRSIDSIKGDMAILRSMGISVKVIKVAMYIRMLITLIPAFIIVAVAAVIIFTTPALNSHFTYLYFWHYAIIFLGMIILTARIIAKQIRRLFKQSVKKSLKGGNAE